jgi:hypothetical protein
MKRLPNVATEMALNVLAYNLTRVMQSRREELALACASCDRSGRSAWPELALGLTPDPIAQKYAQTIVSKRIVPGCVQFLGEKNVFAQPGPKPDVAALPQCSRGISTTSSLACSPHHLIE